ncbi:MAG: S8 family serine peptidase [Chloroflexi bacterium]|nr:S8 family serine peptidase [Chloroflexota bacterium]
MVQQINTQDPDIVAWAEVNYAGGIPEGNPYDIWEWGGQEESGYVNQFAFDQIRLTSAAITVTGSGLIVAVIDSGVSLSHPALRGHLLAGRDLVDNDLIADEEPGGAGWGHGTHVAGIIAHIASDAQILPVRVLDPQGRGNSFAVASALEWAVQQGADVVNLSLGSDSDSRLLREAVQWTIDQRVAVVAAAGNSQSSLPHYPAAYAPVVAVTGVDADGVKATFANYGSEWVDVAAPAVGITSTIVGPQGNGYAGWSGTSMAAAFVSGAMALERQRYPDATVAELAQMVWARADSLDAINPTYAGALGGGLLDMRALLEVPDHFVYMPQLQR